MGASTGVAVRLDRGTVEPVYEPMWMPLVARMFEERKTRLEQVFGTGVREP
jgi:hypothetical protein